MANHMRPITIIVANCSNTQYQSFNICISLRISPSAVPDQLRPSTDGLSEEVRPKQGFTRGIGK